MKNLEPENAGTICLKLIIAIRVVYPFCLYNRIVNIFLWALNPQ